MFSPDATRWFSLVVIAAAAATSACAAWNEARRTRFRPAQYPIYLFGLPLVRILWRAKVVGRFERPAQGGAVVVSNHRGPIDPAFVSLACRDRVRWMVAREYFSVPVFGSMLRILESIPTRRGGVDTAAVKQTIRAARDGALVGVFPEGRINDTDQLMLPLRNGAALMALQARVPLIPCFIEGSPYDKNNLYSFFITPARTTITVGPAIDIAEFYDRADDRQVQNEVTRRLGRAIAVLAGRPDYAPEIVAGRRHADAHDRDSANEASTSPDEQAS